MSAHAGNDDADRRARQLLEQYRSLRLNLDEALAVDRERARVLLAELLGAVRIAPERDGQVWAEIGDPAAETKQAAQGGLSLISVAGACPLHRRLRVR